MKINKLKLISFLIIFLFIISIFLFLRFKAYNYERKYSIDNFEITEKYIKNDQYYLFLIKSGNKSYPYKIESKYLRKKELIEKINVYNNDNEECIIPISDKIDFYILCSNNEDIYGLNLTKVENIPYKYKKIKEDNFEYKKINVNYVGDLNFLVFNYRGFYLINKDIQKDIELFNKDIYSLSLIYQINDYLVVPNYNEDYYFSKFYIINLINGKVKEIKFAYDISYDSVFLGEYKNKIYLLDKKEKKEYWININKEKVELSDFVILEQGKLVKKSFKEINNKNLNFLPTNLFTYEIKNNILYLNINDYKIKITDKLVNKIIKVDNDTVYYLVNDKLYMYNFVFGEVYLMSYFEWNFNNNNTLFIS